MISPVVSKPGTPQNLKKEEEAENDTQKHTLFLDKQKKRKFTIIAPLTVSQAELTRICKWLEVTMIVEDAEPMS